MSGHSWTRVEDALLLKMAAERTPMPDRARALGVSEASVRSRLTRLRLSGAHRDFPEPEIPITVDEPVCSGSMHASTVRVPSDPRELVEKLIKLTKRGADLEELCDRMDLSPKRIRELVESAKSQGYTLDIQGPHVGHRPKEASEDVRPIAVASNRLIAATISDLHFGSRYHLSAQLADFVRIAYERGVRTITCPGDVLEGCYRHAQLELTHHGFHDQANYCAETLPEHPGLSYHFISGNHDQTFSDANGMSVGHALVDVFRSRGRHDFVFHGDRGARLALKDNANERGLVVDLWHPLKGPAYALSYKLQKYVEGLPVGRKPDVVFAGHWHQSVYFNTRGVHAFSSGTFQGGGGPYGKALGGAPSIGGWIYEWAQTEGGTVRRFAPEWIGYFEHETAREIAI